MKTALRHIIHTATALAAALIITACGGSSDSPATPDDPTPTPPPAETTHGVLFFFMGSGTGLQTEMDENVRQIVQKASGIVDDNHKLMIFYDRVYDPVDKNHDTFTRLTEVKKVDGRTKQVTVEEWNPQTTSTVDPDFMASVMKLARQKMNADTYSLVMSSHGGGWIPSDVYDEFVAKEGADNEPSASRALTLTKFFGEDSGSFMEVPQLAKALTEAGKWQCLLFDACFMASVEALYDLRLTADYIIASPAEVMGGGFPYQTVLPCLYEDSEESYTTLCKAFMDKYKGSATPSATVTLVRTSALDALAAAAKPIYAAAAGRTIDASALQGYEGLRPHMFFDLAQYAGAAGATAAQQSAFSRALSDAVAYADHTPTIMSGFGGDKGTISMATCCGLTCHVPVPGYDKTHAAWLATSWAKAVGQ